MLTWEYLIVQSKPINYFLGSQTIQNSGFRILNYFIKKLPKNLHTSKNRCNFALANRQGAIAQLVEQRTENPCVPGSIPGGTTQDR